MGKKVSKNGYDFTEETWRLIEFYEQLFSDDKKIANYKEGGIPQEYINWAENVINSVEFRAILQFEYNNNRNTKDVVNRFYATNRLNRILNKNRYFIEKVSKFGLRFSYIDVIDFLFVTKEAYECGLLKEFLSVPDVWYIIRNIKENWEEIANEKTVFGLYAAV